MAENDLTSFTASIVSSFVAANRVSPEALPDLIKSVYGTLHLIRDGKSAETAEPKSATPTSGQIRKSVTPDALISFIDGKKYRTLKRHLTTQGYTVARYLEEFGLPKDYPLVAPSYSQVRSDMARAMGLGAKGRKSETPVPKTPKPARKRSGKATDE